MADAVSAVAADVKAAAVAISVADTAEHAAQAMPELLALGRGGPHFETRLRPYLNEAIHCLASALEAALIASSDAERAGIGLPRKDGEDAVAVVVRDFLDRGFK